MIKTFVFLFLLCFSTISLSGNPNIDTSKGAAAPSKTYSSMTQASLLPLDADNKRSNWGFGLATIYDNQPYIGTSDSRLSLFPTLNYMGPKLQWIGPTIHYQLLEMATFKISGTILYRFEAYKESDSDQLLGMGNRSGMMMTGISASKSLSSGFLLDLSIVKDFFDVSNGYSTSIAISKPTMLYGVFITPSIGTNYLDSRLAAYEYGVSNNQARSDRKAYDIGGVWNHFLKVSYLYSFSDRTSLMGQISVSQLDAEIRNSPIVTDDYFTSCTFGISYRL